MLKLMNNKGLIFCFFLLVYYNFFNIIIIPDEICKLIRYVLFTYFILASRNIIFKRNKLCGFRGYLIFFVCILFVSMIMADLFWGQELTTTFISSYYFFGFSLYYYLHKKRYSTKDIEMGFIYASIVFVALFMLSHLVYPIRLVRGFGETQGIVDTSRGIARIRLTLMGAAPIYFALFYYVNLIRQEYNIRRLIIIFALFAVVVMQLGRASIALSFVLCVLCYFENAKLQRIIVASILCLALVYFLKDNIPIINNMINLTKDQQSEGDDYIRSLAYNFYLNNVSPNILTDIFGNGQYSLGKSPLGNYVDNFGRSIGLIPADVGYAYIFLNFGYMGWFFWLSVLIVILFMKIPKQYSYIKFYVLFLYLSNFTGNTLLGGIHLLSAAMFILDKVRIRKTN